MSVNSTNVSSGNIKLHTNDFFKFGHIAFLCAVKAGYLIKQGAVNTYSLRRRYFVLYASYLYYFENDEPDSCIGVIFTESSTITIPTVGSAESSFDHIDYKLSRHGDGIIFKEYDNEESFPFVVTTIGGKKCTLFAQSSEDRDSWVDNLISEQRRSLRRRVDQLEDQSKSHEGLRREAGEYEKRATLARTTLVKEIDSLARENKELRGRTVRLEKELRHITHRYEECDRERNILRTARGIIPQVNPPWAQPTQSVPLMSSEAASLRSLRDVSIERHRNVGESQDPSSRRKGRAPQSISSNAMVLKMWVGSWNMGAVPLPLPPTNKLDHDLDLQKFVIPGYGLYAVGVQECVGDSFMHAMHMSLSPDDVHQVDLHTSLEDRGRVHFYSPMETSRGNGRDRVSGRGDGSFLSTKYTGLALYLHQRHQDVIKILAISKFAFSPLTSKGGAAVAVSVAGRTLVFISCHLEAHHENVHVRREQYSALISQLGSSLAEEGFHLNEQFHHIIWVGDMNYRLCTTRPGDSRYIQMSSEEALSLLESCQNRALFEKHDQFNHEKRRREIFYGFREPEPFPNFFPTYKKIENRGPVDFRDPSWVKNTYRLKFKEPLYKGGNVKERTPGFCDRILYYSTPDLSEYLLPEKVVANIEIVHSAEDKMMGAVVPSGQISEWEQTHFKEVIDNYQSVLEGDPFTMSDHSPVFSTFLFRIENYSTRLLQQRVFDDWLLMQKKLEKSMKQTTESSDLDAMVIAICTTSDESDEDIRISSNLDSNAKISPAPNSPGSYEISVSEVTLLCGSSEINPSGLRLLFPQPFEVSHGEQFASIINVNSKDNVDVVGDTMGTCVDLFQNFPKKVKSNKPGWSSIPSDTKTCLSLKYCQSYHFFPVQFASHNPSAQFNLANFVDPVTLMWSHPSIPVKDLHLSLRVAVPSAVITSTTVTTKLESVSLSSSNESEVNGGQSVSLEQRDKTEYMLGHCAVGLNRLWQTAVAKEETAGAMPRGGVPRCGETVTVSVAQVLLRNGRPFYSIDNVSMERELVTLCCKLSLTRVT